MAIGQLTDHAVTYYLDGHLTKDALRRAVKDHADVLEFRNLGLGGSYLSLSGCVRYGESCLEVMHPNGRLVGVIYWQQRASDGHVQYLVQ